MRIVVHEQLDVTDAQRRQIASVLDGKVVKRDATRDEMKAWLWETGAGWAEALTDQYLDLDGSTPAPAPPDASGDDADALDDLLGDADELDDLL